MSPGSDARKSQAREAADRSSSIGGPYSRSYPESAQAKVTPFSASVSVATEWLSRRTSTELVESAIASGCSIIRVLRIHHPKVSEAHRFDCPGGGTDVRGETGVAEDKPHPGSLVRSLHFLILTHKAELKPEDGNSFRRGCRLPSPLFRCILLSPELFLLVKITVSLLQGKITPGHSIVPPRSLFPDPLIPLTTRCI